MPYSAPKTNTLPEEDKSKDKGKGIVEEFHEKLDSKRCFRCQEHGQFQADCPNKRALTIKEIEQIDQIYLETSKEDEEIEEQATILTSDIGEMFVLKRALYAMEDSKEENTSFTHGVSSKARYVA